ncbi:MAG: Fis family transcriptional regulator [Verrucomicrobia bacterium GWF2_62_7]|nr:MAG: Fis family transcriptional regulator [Verrucomicrobia bacterium GWF2_62_7]
MSKTKILVVDDEQLVRWSLEQKLAREGCDVITAASGEEAIERARGNGFDLILLDVRLPGMDGVQTLREIKKFDPDSAVIMLTSDTGVATAVECMRLGAQNYLCKPFVFDQVRAALEKAREEIKLRREVNRIHSQQSHDFGVKNLIGDSQSMRELHALILKIAVSDAATVLIEGENGTGKELAARAIHYGSARADQPLMDLNCSAVPETLLETELFGHERGAFTDAKAMKKGLFELADGGTVLLDEIGDMKPVMQVKLLRVLETRSFRRVGGTQEITTDIRVVAMTNKNLQAAVKAGAFRQDLYYRLQIIPMRVPALREHPEDVPALAAHFLQRFAGESKSHAKQVSAEALKALQQYHWPGNVRELRNVIERIVILEADAVIRLAHLPPEIRAEAAPPQQQIFELPPAGISLARLEMDVVHQAMDRACGNQTLAAKLLSLGRSSLRRRLMKHGYRVAPSETEGASA